MSNTIDLQGKKAVVTGGAPGHRPRDRGAAAGLRRRGRDLGPRPGAGRARRRRIRAITAAPSRSLATSTRKARSSAPATPRSRAFGRIDILVNNAGIAGPNVKTWEYDPEAWAEVMRVNLDSQFLCCRAVVPLMIAQNYGRIVNIASIAGKEGNPNAVAYSASKAGVIALTKSLGKELAGYDIAVNCITPAAARTAIFDQMTQAAHRLHAVENSRAAVSSRSTRSRRWWRSAPRPSARSRPARCSTFPAGGRPIDRPRARAAPPAAHRHRR